MVMTMHTEDVLENIPYALKCTVEVAMRRKNTRAIALCEELGIQLETITLEDHRSRVMLRMSGVGCIGLHRTSCLQSGLKCEKC